MRRLLPPSLSLLLPLAAPFASLLAQDPAPQGASPNTPQAPEPIIAEAPASTPDLAAAPASTSSAPTPGTASTKLSYSSCNVDGPLVAMTFDDGPHAQNTPRLLDILKQRGIKATFFVVGQNAAEYPDILKRIVAEGHELANHSYTHPILASLGESGLRDQLDKTHQAVLKATGVSMKVMRPPYGALSQPQRVWTNANFGYKTILWDVDPLDWKYKDASRVETEILGHVKPGSIILSHDIHKTTVDAMPSTLDTLTAKGFKFVTVSELIALDKPAAPKAGAPPKPTVKTNPKPAPSADSKAVAKSSKDDASAAKTTAETKENKSASTTPKSAGSGGAPAGGSKTEPAPKTSQLSQEELRKKWLQSMNQR